MTPASPGCSAECWEADTLYRPFAGGSAYYILHEELELILNQLCLLVGCCTQSCVLYQVPFPAKIGDFMVGLFTGRQEPLWNENLDHLLLVGFLTCGWRSPRWGGL